MSSDAHGGFRTLVKTMLSHHHGARHSQAAAAEVYQTSTIVTWFKPETTIPVTEATAHEPVTEFREVAGPWPGMGDQRLPV